MLLCNLSEPEVEEASPADCDEPCLVTESDETIPAVAENKTAEVECCTEVSCVDYEASSSHNDHNSQQTSASSAVPARTSDRKKRSDNHGIGTTSRKKQKIQ